MAGVCRAAQEAGTNRVLNRVLTSECYIANISNMTSQPDFPAILRAVRAAQNLTQEQLAERLGVSFATVDRKSVV